MVTIGYGICLLISVGVFIYMAQKNYNTIDVDYWTIVILVPIVILGYWLKTLVTTKEAASFLMCFIYIESTFLVTTLLFSMLHTMGIPVSSWMKIFSYGAAGVHMAIVCLCVHNTLYYQSVRVVRTDAGSATLMTSGPLWTYHSVFLGAIFLLFAALLLGGFNRKGTYSFRTLVTYAAFFGTGLAIHLAENLTGAKFTVLPLLYVIGDLVIALDYDYEHAHDISCVLSEHQKNHSSRGYAAIGINGQFLSCNDRAFVYLPSLKTQRVDSRITGGDEQRRMILDLIDGYENDKKTSEKFQVGDMTCVCEISPFSIRRDGKMQGYLLDIRDATEEQRNYDIITSYNETLNAEVIEKTNNIKDMQRKIVLGMANMIENRDNNTGGHVKRTSDIIHIIVNEIIRQGNIHISDEFARDIVRAAPTHDLGKITIDESILNKPGRLTEEEFTIMKTHSSKSGEMVLILLEGVEEERFVKVAFNVARYHHERWDGRGYPDGLVGTMIPLEARIMAVADVYDALVSKRVYKEPMSFDKAYDIMCSSMGKQFDPNMKSVFIGCRQELEQYYTQND